MEIYFRELGLRRMDVIYAVVPASNKEEQKAYRNSPAEYKIVDVNELIKSLEVPKQLWVYRMVDGIFVSRMVEWDPKAVSKQSY